MLNSKRQTKLLVERTMLTLAKSNVLVAKYKRHLLKRKLSKIGKNSNTTRMMLIDTTLPQVSKLTYKEYTSLVPYGSLFLASIMVKRKVLHLM